jgi:hypothetical protein
MRFSNIQGLNYLEQIYIIKTGQFSPASNQLNESKGQNISDTEPEDDMHENLITDGDFSQNSKSAHLLSSSWIDPLRYCGAIFVCNNSNTRGGWNDSSSFSVSTDLDQEDIGSSNVWSFIQSNPVSVLPGKNYAFITHMNANQWTLSSHIVLEGFNKTSQQWYQIMQCPSAVKGTARWSAFVCELKMPHDTGSVRVILNAGMSTTGERDAVTLFDGIYLVELNKNKNDSIAYIKKLVSNSVDEEQSINISQVERVNPAYWSLKLNTSATNSTLVFAEPFDPSWQMKVYKDSALLETARSYPVYGALNGFTTNVTGNLTVEISYARQYWFEIGMIISASIFVTSLVLALYFNRRN